MPCETLPAMRWRERRLRRSLPKEPHLILTGGGAEWLDAADVR